MRGGGQTRLPIIRLLGVTPPPPPPPPPGLGLTGPQGGGRDLDLTGDLVGMEGRRPAAGAEVRGEQVGALGPRGAGAGTVAAMVGLLLVVHGHQLEWGGRAEVTT